MQKISDQEATQLQLEKAVRVATSTTSYICSILILYMPLLGAITQAYAASIAEFAEKGNQQL